ncbi:NUDIX hydrolase [Microbacterium sediminis]|uniref:DNA mismatch repair protein MutT n=1 Tax=Microbacterium sediminis TaxID=904291 RepID=A0A1B9N816_9MICO|nr:NUDIX domain-containing protein [Microbacterium sediminis]OCG72737.1 DNA mismatch repair protein MutT [Microbacterium sediminis]
MTDRTVYAAGGVLWRVADGRLRIALVHRTKYRDVTLPKGKIEPGEMLAETAVREVHEETGIRASLGVPLGVSHYHLPNGREKIVHYWAMRAKDRAIRESSFVPNKEIAAVEWIGPKQALARLSYPVDQEILESFLTLFDDGVRATFPIVALRHGKAVARGDWDRADYLRPLHPKGRDQSQAIVGAMRAFGVKKIVSSTATRCVQTVTPLSRAIGEKIVESELLSQDAGDDQLADVRPIVGKRVASGKPAVICTHRPVLPSVLDELALATGTIRTSASSEAADLSPGSFSVVHISADNPGSGIAAIETHAPAV